MVWRRLLVLDTCTLCELHGMIQVAMGWEVIHLYQFYLRSRRYGSWEVSASSPDVTLAALKLRRGARFTYEGRQKLWGDRRRFCIVVGRCNGWQHVARTWSVAR